MKNFGLVLSVFALLAVSSLAIAPSPAAGAGAAPEGRLYIVGLGCGDADLLTLRARDRIAACDYVVCMEDLSGVFARIIDGKRVLFDPLMQVARFYRKKHPESSVVESERAAERIYRENIETLRTHLKNGKNVAILEPGDPTIFGGWRNWVFPHFPKEQIEIVPGVSSFNAANALFGDGTVTKGSVIISEPSALAANEGLVANAAKSGDTLVVFMALNRTGALAELLKRHYGGGAVVHIVYHAGIAGKERRVSTTVDGLAETVRANGESFMGLLYVGAYLDRREP